MSSWRCNFISYISPFATMSGFPCDRMVPAWVVWKVVPFIKAAPEGLGLTVMFTGNLVPVQTVL